MPAEQLLQSIQALISMVKVYQANNRLVLNSMRQLVEAAESLLAGNDSLVIHLENGRFFVNDEKLLRRKGLENILDNFYTYLADRRIPGFRIVPSISTAPPEELASFASSLNRCGDQPEPAEWLEGQLLENRVGWISILQTDENLQTKRDPDPQELEAPGRRYPRKIYAYTLRALRDATRQVAEGERFGMRKAARMIQTMVEEVCSTGGQLLAMSTVREYSDIIYIHSVNVTILSLYLGRELGFPKEALEHLGTSALFHDLGKVVQPPELLNKEEMLTREELARLQQHSMKSVRLILQLMVAPVARKARIMMPPFEHHLKADLSGYPALGWRKQPSLAGRIVAVADAYDALTSARVYRRRPMSGDRALGLMRMGAGSAFSPLVLKAFVRMMGLYPLGTLLELDTGEIALVSRPPAGGEPNQLWALLLEEDGRGGFSPGEEVNLGDPDGSEHSGRKIVGSAHPSARNIQPARFLT